MQDYNKHIAYYLSIDNILFYKQLEWLAKKAVEDYRNSDTHNKLAKELGALVSHMTEQSS